MRSCGAESEKGSREEPFFTILTNLRRIGGSIGEAIVSECNIGLCVRTMKSQ